MKVRATTANSVAGAVFTALMADTLRATDRMLGAGIEGATKGDMGIERRGSLDG